MHIVLLRLPFLVELEFGNVGFFGERKTRVPGKIFQREGEKQQQSQPTYRKFRK